MAWNDAVVTNAGINMLRGLVGGKALQLTHAQGGTGIAPSATLKEKTQLQDSRQNIDVVSSMPDKKGQKIKLQITNVGLTEGYLLQQIGIWSRVSPAAPGLFVILQDAQGIRVPSSSEVPNFILSFYIIVSFSNDTGFHVEVDPGIFVSMGTLTELLGKKADLDSSGKVTSAQLPTMDYIPTSEKGNVNGVAQLDDFGKLLESQLPDLSALGVGVGICNSSAAAKVVTIESFVQSTFARVIIRFAYAVQQNSSLNINNEGSRAIYFNGTNIQNGYIPAGAYALLFFDGSYWQLMAVGAPGKAAALQNPIGIGLSGVGSINQKFDGSQSIAIPVTSVPPKLITDGTLSGTVVAQNNTLYTTKQIRNIIESPNSPSGGSNGDIWLKYN